MPKLTHTLEKKLAERRAPCSANAVDMHIVGETGTIHTVEGRQAIANIVRQGPGKYAMSQNAFFQRYVEACRALGELDFVDWYAGLRWHRKPGMESGWLAAHPDLKRFKPAVTYNGDVYKSRYALETIETSPSLEEAQLSAARAAWDWLEEQERANA